MRFALIINTVAALIVSILAGTPAWAVDLNRPITFQIPAQRLSRALLEFSHQAHVQIIVGPEVGERATDGIFGTYSIGDALTMLLRGSSLGYRVINETSITVGSVAALERESGKAQPPPIKDRLLRLQQIVRRTRPLKPHHLQSHRGTKRVNSRRLSSPVPIYPEGRRWVRLSASTRARTSIDPAPQRSINLREP